MRLIQGGPGREGSQSSNNQPGWHYAKPNSGDLDENYANVLDDYIGEHGLRVVCKGDK